LLSAETFLVRSLKGVGKDYLHVSKPSQPAVSVPHEFFRLKMREKFCESVEAPQADLDVWRIHYNTEHPHLGYRNEGGRPIETVNLFVNQEA